MATDVTNGNGLWLAVGGWIVAILLGLFTFIVQFRRGGVDETAVVLTKWKELVDAHEKQIRSLRDEIERLEQRVEELIEEVRGLRKDNAVLKEQNEELTNQLEGERRQAQQQARSFRSQLRALGKNDVPEERDDDR